MPGKKRKTAVITGLFASFIFLQYVLLRIGNQAGRGFLTTERQEKVYYCIQVFAVLGFLVYAGIHRLLTGKSERAATTAALALFAAGAAGMLLTPADAALSLVFTFFTVLLLGYTGGAVYLRMANAADNGENAALGMGFGCAMAVALQYVTQLRWTVTPALYALSAAAFAVLFVLLRREQMADETIAAASGAPATPGTVLFPVLITTLLLLFTAFYNGYIHHLQIVSGYTEYNVYSWPRLIWIPGYLLFGFLGHLKNRRVLPIAVICTVVTALLNSVLAGSGGEPLNMCLFYLALSASVSYYNIVFWHVAPRTKQPALWASAGRMLDSILVLVFAGLRISALPAVAVLSVNIAALAGVIVLMAVNGDFNLAASPAAGPQPEGAFDNAPPAEDKPSADPFAVVQEKYGLTPGEMKVFRELVLTEDKQTVIGERLSIKVRTVQANVTSIYRKTGVSTRSGLGKLYHDAGEP